MFVCICVYLFAYHWVICTCQVCNLSYLCVRVGVYTYLGKGVCAACIACTGFAVSLRLFKHTFGAHTMRHYCNACRRRCLYACEPSFMPDTEPLVPTHDCCVLVFWITCLWLFECKDYSFRLNAWFTHTSSHFLMLSHLVGMFKMKSLPRVWNEIITAVWDEINTAYPRKSTAQCMCSEHSMHVGLSHCSESYK